MAVLAANSQRSIRIPLGRLREAARAALSSLGLENAELSVLIAGDTRLRSLNRVYRGLDRTTDVLSFSAEGLAKPGSPVVLGDVVISAPRALAQAREAGHSLTDELIFLLVHGILHLAGYDHEGGAAKRLRMEKKQREILELLKLK